jgi:hypothetical protein
VNWNSRTYHRHDLILDLFGERDDLHVYGKVNLYYVSIRVHVNPVQGAHTEVRSMAMLMVCWARVMFAVLVCSVF